MPWDYGEENDPPVWHDHPLEKYKTKRSINRGLKPVDCLVTRDQWGAVPPTATEKLRSGAPFFFNLPPSQFGDHIHFTHTKTPECFETEECIKIVKGLQEEHMGRGETDILPSFLVGGDGKIYEGRGWDVQPKVPDQFTATLITSLDFAMIGDFSKKKVPKEMISPLKKLTHWAIINKKLYCCFKKTFDYEFHRMFWSTAADLEP